MISLTNVKQNKKIGICSFDEVSTESPIVLALGMFDGVHVGHRRLLDETVRLAHKYNASPTVMTFVNHPSEIISPRNIPKLLTTVREKAMLASDCGIRQMILLWFDEMFSVLSPTDFIESYIMGLNVKAVVCGYNYCFGKNAAGNAYMLKSELEKYDVETSVIDNTEINGKTVSSTNIRSMVQSGDIENANIFLGAEYQISGNVVHGFERGRKLGFPTANIIPKDEKCLPPNGVYATKTVIDAREYVSVTNIGKNPTFGNENITVETFILDFDDDIYDKYITVKFFEKQRDEMRLNTMEELMRAIENDKRTAAEFFERNKL